MLFFLLSLKLFTLTRRGTVWPSSTAQSEILIWYFYTYICLCVYLRVDVCVCLSEWESMCAHLRARVCVLDLAWQVYIITDQCLCCLASWLIHPFPLDRTSLSCPTSHSLACYHDNTTLPLQGPSLSPCPNSPSYPQTASVTDFIWVCP